MPKRSLGYFKGRICYKCNKDLSSGIDHGIKYYDVKENISEIENPLA